MIFDIFCTFYQILQYKPTHAPVLMELTVPLGVHVAVQAAEVDPQGTGQAEAGHG